MWDPQKYDRGISMGPMCDSPPSIWAAHVGPAKIESWDFDGLHVWQPTFYMGSPRGTRKNIIVGFRWAPCVAASLLYGSPRGTQLYVNLRNR